MRSLFFITLLLSTACTSFREKRAFQKAFQNSHAVGAAFAIVTPQGIEWMDTAGYSDLYQKTPVREETLFRWASLSKGVTAVGVLLAEREDLLHQSSTVREIWPKYPRTSKDIEVRHLLTHTSGIASYGNHVKPPIIPPEELTNDPKVNTGMEWAIHRFWKVPLTNPPGTEFHYSTYGYNLLGVLLEKTSGERYFDFLKKRIFDRFGMTSIRPDWHWVHSENRSHLYRFKNGRASPSDDSDVSWKVAGGGFISSIRDLALYCQALMDDHFLPSELKDKTLFAPWVRSTEEGHEKFFYGYGFYIYSKDGRRIVEHDGIQQGARSLLRLYPEDHLCYVMLTNTGGIDPYPISRAVEDIRLKGQALE